VTKAADTVAERQAVSRLALDSSVLVAWILQQPPVWQAVDDLVLRSGIELLVPAPVVTEVIYVVRARGNTAPPRQIAEALTGVGLRVEHLVNADLVRAAELVEASRTQSRAKTGRRRTTPAPQPSSPQPSSPQPSLSLADAMILAVAERLQVAILTRDRYWSELADGGVLATTVRQL